MLSPAGDDNDDDNHLCIKCNATIIGLDNYVKHRKERCGKNKYHDMVREMKTSKSEMSGMDSLEPTYSLGADVFFQSLELQSSVKKTSLSRLTPPVSSSKTSSNIERKSSSLIVSSLSRDVPRMSPLESNLRGEDWIGGHTLRIGGHEDNQTRLINAVNSISGVAKKDIPSTSYSITPYEFKEELIYDEASDDSDEEEEEDAHASGGKWKPPLHHTGGKWRPASPDNEDWDMREEHTGGKWKPIMLETQDRDDDYDAPPPDHTKGKWVPGANEQKTQIMQNTIQSKGAVQYWCGACNRRLGSKAIYEKHLQSNLHMRKVLPENDLEFSGHIKPTTEIKTKRKSKPSAYLNMFDLGTQTKKRKKGTLETAVQKIKNKRKRNPYFVHCSGCKSRVRLHLMGKHLISHYHFRKATGIQSKTYQQLILDNIEAIVHQSPFQCSPCKFYTNWLSNLMQHWFTEEHEKKMASIEGRYWCSFCKFECEHSQDMLHHLSSPGHGEVVAVINRSMPIIIRKKTVIKCKVCFKEFRYNIELKKHCKMEGHELTHTATDLYQELHSCEFCLSKFKSSLTLAAHLKNKHKQKTFFCLVCTMTFNSSAEAKTHRYTSEHRIRQKEKMIERGVPIKDLSKKCPYCAQKTILKNVIELKEHIRTVHPDIKKKCPKCGMAFVLPQEVTRHMRKNACSFQDSDPSILKSKVLWKCSQCPFQTDSQAECYFHEVLHTKPDVIQKKSKDPEKVVKKYTCPLCPKSYRKESLRLHIRQHTFERPFVCSACSANFTRQTALTTHVKTMHGVKLSHSTDASKEPMEIEGSKDATILEPPATSISEAPGRLSPLDGDTTPLEEDLMCSYPNCIYFAKTLLQLSRHKKTHGEKMKRHQCPECDFKTDQASHMKRHLICHEGTKPYGCPHCDFICASLENLRKHSARRHARPLYACALCPHAAARAVRMRGHLLRAHAERYSAREAAAAVKQQLLRKQR